jgi:hypothetical protein
MASAYGDKYVDLRYCTPRGRLEERWGLSIPTDVKDNDILSSGLLSEEVSTHEGQSFWDAILGHFYGNAFTFKTFPLASLPTLLVQLDDAKLKIVSGKALAVWALRDRLDQWEHLATSEAVRTLIRRLGSEPGKLRRDLALYKILANYPPQLGEKVLGSIWATLRKAHVQPEDSQVSSNDIHTLLPDIDYYLTEARSAVASSEDLAVLVSQVSGHLLTEFNTIEELIREHPEWVTPELLRRIEQRFRPIEPGVRKLMSGLRQLVPPPVPPAPLATWSAGEWLDWVRNSYMPFYSWLDHQGKQDDTLAGYAATFADWFYENFIQIKNGQPELFAFSALYAERDRMSASGSVVVVLVLDNMNFSYFEDLSRLLNQQGFSLEESRPLLSLVPTATEVGKGGVISGRGDQIDIGADRYPKLIEEEWNPILQGKQAIYLPNVGELQQLRALKHDIYFLNYLPTDKVLHDDNRDTGRPHAEMVHDALAALVEATAEFGHRFGIEDRLLVYVVSDHGSTRIGRHVVNVLDKAFFKKVALDQHHRYIALTDEQFAQLPQVADVQCYRIDRHTFKTNKNYLAAREYYRFVETTGNFYVHGGLTPEEVVVPFARFSRVPRVPVPPTVTLLSNEFRYEVKSRVRLEVGNPNTYPLEELTVRLLNMGSDEVTLEKLPAKQTSTIEIPTVFRKRLGTGRYGSITARINYMCQGRECNPVEHIFEINLKSLIEENQDDFDF